MSGAKAQACGVHDPSNRVLETKIWPYRTTAVSAPDSRVIAGVMSAKPGSIWSEGGGGWSCIAAHGCSGFDRRSVLDRGVAAPDQPPLLSGGLECIAALLQQCPLRQAVIVESENYWRDDALVWGRVGFHGAGNAVTEDWHVIADVDLPSFE